MGRGRRPPFICCRRWTVGWGVHGLFLVGACGGIGAPPCPPELGWFAAAVAVGTIVAIAAGAAGPCLAPAFLFPAVGLAALLAAPQLTGGGRLTALILGSCFMAVILIPLPILSYHLARQRRTDRLIETGAAGVGTLLNVQDTGVTVNRNPRVVLTLRIEPEDGSEPFDVDKTLVVRRVELPRRGQRFPVWYDRADPTNPRHLVVVTRVEKHTPAAVRARFEKAQRLAGGWGGAGAGASMPANGSDPLERFAMLYDLYEKGALTAREFQAQKQRILQPEAEGYQERG